MSKALSAFEQAELQRQVIELSAQVEVMREALEFFKTFVFDNRVTGTEVVRRANTALSIPPSSALLAHDNEVAAKALEEAMQAIVDKGHDAYEVIYRMATERRNRK